jgi:NitT/TauT family transport system substrate-binding protein
VASGGAQFGIDWLSALLVSRDEGVPIENIAQIYQASGMRLITFKSSGITSIQGFKHKKVGVWFSGNQYQFMALMAKYHMSPPTSYMTVVKEPFTMDTFLNHSYDVAHAMTYNELGVVYEHGIKRSQLRIWDYNKLGVSILEDGIFAKTSWAQAHRSTVVAFLKASIKGWKYAVAHPNEAGQISYKYAPSGTSTLAHQKYMARQVAKLIMYGPGKSHPIGYMDPTAFKRSWTALLQQKVIKKAPTNAYDQSYWQAASSGM